MRLSLATLLCFRFCVVQAYEDFYWLPLPRIEVEPNYPVPVGKELTLHCLGFKNSLNYRLLKQAVERPLTNKDTSWESTSPKFHYPNASQEMAGRFRCMYLFRSFWSKLSQPQDVYVTDLYPQPYLWATPGLSIPLGQSVTFHCNSTVGLDLFVLYHGDEKKGFEIIQPKKYKMNEAIIPIINKTSEMNGKYRCYGYMSSEPHRFSVPSDILVLRGVGLPPRYCATIHFIHVVLALSPLGSLLL